VPEDHSDNGWDRSAGAWLANQGEAGDYGRRAVLDPVMLRLAREAGGRFIDIGCGEGRFVRMLKGERLDGVGIDPTRRLIDHALLLDPAGDYRVGRAEELPHDDNSFDCAVFYLSLCDIPDLAAALREAVRVVRPGGRLLIANLSSINTAGVWQRDLLGRATHYAVDDYMVERPVQQRWAGIDIQNWHRPFSTYFAALLGAGLELREFLEPLPVAAAPPKPKFNRMPNFVVMRWDKPA
jgi:SAM-dependent methyltransferase